jgi:hypothetical protein
MNLAANQRAQRRDRTNVYMCHLDHLLQLPWAHHRRVPPTEAARPKLSVKDAVDCGGSKALTFAAGVARVKEELELLNLGIGRADNWRVASGTDDDRMANSVVSCVRFELLMITNG